LTRTALAAAMLFSVSMQPSGEEPRIFTPKEIGKIARIDPSILIPTLAHTMGAEFSIVLTLSNPSQVPVELDSDCLGREPFKLSRVPDGSAIRPRRLSLAKSLTIGPGQAHRQEIRFKKLFGTLKSTGRYRLSWTCGEWSTPMYEMVCAEPFDAEKDKVAVVTTDFGVMEMALLTSKAPEHVKNFVQLAKQGFYDGVRFYKIVAGMQAETGDITGSGRGGWSQQMPPEIDGSVFPGKGFVAAVRAETSMTSASQFFFLLEAAPLHQGKHTFFAYVRKGEDVLDRLSAVPVGSHRGVASFAPLQDVHIRKIEIREE